MEQSTKLENHFSKDYIMEDARLAQELRKKGTTVTSKAEVMSKPVLGTKPAPPKTMLPPKTAVAQAAQTPAVQAAQPPTQPVKQSPAEAQKSTPDNRGFFVGLDPSGKPFFKILGKVTDTEYLALVKFAELQLNTTLDLYKPTSNLKIIKLLNEMSGKEIAPQN